MLGVDSETVRLRIVSILQPIEPDAKSVHNNNIVSITCKGPYVEGSGLLLCPQTGESHTARFADPIRSMLICVLSLRQTRGPEDSGLEDPTVYLRLAYCCTAILFCYSVPHLHLQHSNRSLCFMAIRQT